MRRLLQTSEAHEGDAMSTMLRTMVRTTTLAATVLLLVACTAVSGPTAVPATPTSPPPSAFPTAEPLALPRIPHAVEGFTNCLICHSPEGGKPIPANHALYTVDRCLDCHRPALAITSTVTLTPQPMAHPIAGHEDCSLCHAPDRLEMPNDHYTMDQQECTECHLPPADPSAR